MSFQFEHRLQDLADRFGVGNSDFTNNRYLIPRRYRDRRTDAQRIRDLEAAVHRLTNDNSILAAEVIAMRKAGR